MLQALCLVTLLGACAPSHQQDGRPVGQGRTEYATEIPPVRVVRLEVHAADPDVAARVRAALVAAVAPRYECVAAGACEAVLELHLTFWRAGRRPGETLAGGWADFGVPGEAAFFRSRFSKLTFEASHAPEEFARWLAARLP